MPYLAPRSVLCEYAENEIGTGWFDEKYSIQTEWNSKFGTKKTKTLLFLLSRIDLIHFHNEMNIIQVNIYVDMKHCIFMMSL